MKGRREALFLAGLSFVVRLFVVVWGWSRVPPTADGSFYHVVAGRIAEGQGYTWLWPDGVVTYAAHYPIGYPAFLGAVYFLVGSSVGAAMVANALLGALLVCGVHRITERWLLAGSFAERAHAGARSAAIFAALSPTLVLYTPALMTEGAVATLLVVALWIASRAHDVTSTGGRISYLVGLGLVLGAATLVRPQSILFSPLFGLFASGPWRRSAVFRKLAAGVFVSLLSLAVVLPWTARNCDKMERCVFVSANGGWNLLIGTFPEGKGAWVPIDAERVPKECREVFHEAKKDECFGAAGRRRIEAAPLAWLSLAPAKWRMTFDFTASATDHLIAAGAIPERAKLPLKSLEIASHRILLVLVGLGVVARLRLVSSRRARFGVALGLALAVGLSAYGSFLGIVLFGTLAARRDSRPEYLLPLSMSLTTFAVHAAFFGAGRYFLPLLPLLAPLGAVGLLSLGRSFDSERPSER